MNCQGLNWRKWMFLVGQFSVQDSPLKELHQQHQFSGSKRVNKKAPQKGRDWTLGLSTNQPWAFITPPPPSPRPHSCPRPNQLTASPAAPCGIKGHCCVNVPKWSKWNMKRLWCTWEALSHWRYTEYHVNEWAIPSVSLKQFSCYGEIPFVWKWQLKNLKKNKNGQVWSKGVQFYLYRYRNVIWLW